jgi:excisionase family DNA binding protein
MHETTELCTTAEVADRLRVSKATILRLVRQGDLRPMRLSKRTLRFTESDVARFMEGGGRAAQA